MECNKDEAARAKSIAEAKLENKDFAGAKKFVLKAQTLYPRLDGISQMLMTLDVYLSAEKKINGQVNWYGVLGVGPTAEDETIKKQYRKLALMLHPDKNNSVGADGAFKLISEAWGLLSDKAKRSSYNLITGHKGPQQKIPTTTNCPRPSTVHPTSTSRPGTTNVQPTRTSRPTPLNVHPTSTNRPSSSNVYPGSCNGAGGPPVSSTEPVFTKSAKRKQPATKSQKKTKVVPAPPKSAPTLKAESFWTICSQCKIQYEYHNMYRNTTLLCTHCKIPFVAIMIPRPVTKSKLPKPSPGIPVQKQKNQSTSAAKNVRGKNVVPAAQKSGVGKAGPKFPMRTQQPHPTASTNVISAAGPSVAAKVTILEDKPKRPLHTELNSGTDGLKKTKLGSHNGGGAYRKNYNSNNKVHDGQKDISVTTGNKLDAKVPGEPTYLETRKLLMGKARKEISRKMNEMSVEMLVDNANKRKINKAKKRQVGPADNMEKGRKSEKLSSNSHKKENRDLSGESNTAVMMNVLDPDFFDFDQDRSHNSFVENDVWAAYDDDDGMPRFYALIHKVVSKRPFQLKISWLNSKTTTEFSPTLDWVGSGFYKTCGEFRVGKHKLCGSVNAFSQSVKWSKGPRGTILIFPQKGDVWALYKNWSTNWDMQTPDDVIHKYDMVVVLDGYDEEKGLVSVSPLVKVAGFRTVFCPDIRMEAVVEIQREEMFRFSHRVPHHTLTSQEAPGAPDGCVELDPAATPSDLLGIESGSDVGNESAGVKEA